MLNPGINKCFHPICFSNQKAFHRRQRGLLLCYNINISFVKIVSLFFSKMSKYIDLCYRRNLVSWKWSFTFRSITLILQLFKQGRRVPIQQYRQPNSSSELVQFRLFLADVYFMQGSYNQQLEPGLEKDWINVTSYMRKETK